MRTVTVGVLGCGTVGQDVLHLLRRRKDIFDNLGVRVEVAGVLVRDTAKARSVPGARRSPPTPPSSRSAVW